jgi:hypothetical protein
MLIFLHQKRHAFWSSSFPCILLTQTCDVLTTKQNKQKITNEIELQQRMKWMEKFIWTITGNRTWGTRIKYEMWHWKHANTLNFNKHKCSNSQWWSCKYTSLGGYWTSFLCPPSVFHAGPLDTHGRLGQF